MEAQSPSKKAAKSPQSSAHLGSRHVAPLQAALAPAGPFSSSPASASASAVLIRREAKHRVLGLRCPGELFPGPPSSPARGRTGT